MDRHRKSLDELSNVFGTFSHAPPSPTAAEISAQNAPPPLPGPAELPPSPVISQHTGLLLIPSVRFDGDAQFPPWNESEAMLWDELREAQVEHIEERVLDGAGGVFWARVRIGEDLRSAYLKFEDPSGGLYRRWADEYLFDDQYGLLKREAAAYEIVKALGVEDLCPPLVLRDIDPVPLISDAVRERIAGQLRISPIDVDERLGMGAVVQLMPSDADDFVETWGNLGIDNRERWVRASDRLRHSIYRAYAIDFLLGVEERPLCSYLYNVNTDRLVIVNLQLSFPHPGMTAERYIEARSKGWGRKNTAGLEMPASTEPASAWDLPSIFDGLSDQNIDEALVTFKQIGEAFPDEVAVHAARVMAEHDVPLQGIAGFFARMAYLQIEPRSVLERGIEVVRNVFVPLRRGYGLDNPTNAQIIEYVNAMISQVSDEGVDFLAIVGEQPGDQEEREAAAAAPVMPPEEVSAQAPAREIAPT